MKQFRLISLLLTVLAVFSLAACSSKEAPVTEASSETSAAVLPTEDPVEIGTNGERIFDDSRNIVLFEDESCAFTLNKAEIDSLSDYNWVVTLENRTMENQIYTVDEVYVNDIAFDPGWAVRSEAGRTDEEHIIWTAPEMEKRNITQINRVDFRLRIYPDGNSQAAFADEYITVYPSGKSAYLPQNRNPQTTDVVFLDNDSYTFMVTGYDPDSRWGYGLDLYVVNKTDSPVEFFAENVKVNDAPCDPQWACTMGPGKQGTSKMLWFTDALEAAEVEAVSSVNFDLVVRDLSGTQVFKDSYVLIP